MNIKTPYICIKENGDIEIIGEAAALDALGNLLIAKAKLGKHLSATFNDGVNKKIHITSDDDLKL